MTLLKRIMSFIDVEHIFRQQFGNLVTQTFTQPDIGYTITHDLQHVPVGFRKVDQDLPAEIYRVGDATTTDITLASNVGGVTATLEIF
uniref:Uncharacterized protein n=1 Tax=viral metagenome TaxID=1070528 RepID=A0A6M3L738_9ZZZZ